MIKIKNQTLLTIILIVVVGSGSFFAGMKYQQSKQSSRPDFASLRGLRDGMNQQGGENLQPRAGQRMVRGEIIDKDEESITVKLPNESSKIVLVFENTIINKATEGSMADLEFGKEVAVFGQENSDGSVSATNIQLAPQSIR